MNSAIKLMSVILLSSVNVFANCRIALSSTALLPQLQEAGLKFEESELVLDTFNADFGIKNNYRLVSRDQVDVFGVKKEIIEQKILIYQSGKIITETNYYENLKAVVREVKSKFNQLGCR